jgi:hypothetical protein
MPDGGLSTIHRITSSNRLDDFWDDNTEHLGMTKNPIVQQMVLNLLAGIPVIQTAEAGESIPPAEPAYYLNVFGSSSAYITNVMDQTTGVVSPTLLLQEAREITYLPSSTGNFLAVIPTAGVYTVTFQSGDEPMWIELTRKGDAPPDYLARWRDLSLPPNTTLQLRLTADGVQDLRYDSNGDGAPDQPVAEAPVIATGPAAADTQPPTVTVTVAADRAVSILAEDASGIKAIYYSFDGSNFQPYTAPVVAPVTATAVYAFADDALANRSALVTQNLAAPAEVDLYLPLINR